jgi:transposase
MDRTRIDEGVLRMRFASLLERQEGGEITQAEAAELLGVRERTFRRWRDRYREEGEAGLDGGRLGRRSPRRAPEAEIERMLGLYRDKYSDFTVKHFHEQLVRRHDYKLGYTVTKVHLHRAGLVRAGGEALGAPQEAAAATTGGHAAASGWLAACLAGGPTRARSDRYDG